jgi:methionine biosynthesis protein MetW
VGRAIFQQLIQRGVDMADARVKGQKGRSAIKEVFGDMPIPESVSSSVMDYEDYWENRKEKMIMTEPARRRARGILPFVGAGDSVLDVGCGTGETLEVLRDEKRINGTGLDISETALKIVESKGFATIRKDLSKPDSELAGVWDHIVLFEVAEHVTDTEVLIKHLSGHYRKGLYISTPNLGYLAHRLRMLFGRFPVTYISDPREHLRYWSVKDFVYWSGVLGFNKPEVLGLRGKPAVFRLPARFPSLLASEVVYRFKP